MRSFLPTLVFTFIYTMSLGQAQRAIAGDWILTEVEYSDGSRLTPAENEARLYKRHYFHGNKVFVVLGIAPLVIDFSQVGNTLRIGPIQTFNIEQYSDKAMTLVQIKKEKAERQFFIPIDSFTVSNLHRYEYTISGEDTVYAANTGISPLYLLEGELDLMSLLHKQLGTLKTPLTFSFVIKKDGTVGMIEILSDDEKLKNKLTKTLEQTSGKWLPGSIGGKPINVKITQRIASVSIKYR